MKKYEVGPPIGTIHNVTEKKSNALAWIIGIAIVLFLIGLAGNDNTPADSSRAAPVQYEQVR